VSNVLKFVARSRETTLQKVSLFISRFKIQDSNIAEAEVR